MRAGPLSDPTVAALLEESFVCAWEKKGAVQCYRAKGGTERGIKVGGNVLSYVLTPSGEVLHAIPGSWPAEPFAAELRWARTLHQGMGTEDPMTVVRAAHRDRPPGQWRGGAEALLSSKALLPLADVEKTFFETLLHETYQPDLEIIIREVDPAHYRRLVAQTRVV